MSELTSDSTRTPPIAATVLCHFLFPARPSWLTMSVTRDRGLELEVLMRACLLALLLVPGAATAAEKWADRSVKLPADVALWLDAAAQPAAYAAHGRNLANGMTLDIWYDGSGNKRHVSQLAANLQPRYYEAEGVGLVRFHGQEFLARTATSPALEEFTLFVVTVPRSNRGDFAAWLSLSALGKNDFQTGLTIDQSYGGTDKFSQVNIEGKGFGKAVNLMKESGAFGQLRLLRIDGGTGPRGIRLFVDNQPQGTRPRDAGMVAMDTITVGARCYSNTDDRPSARGFLDGDIAELLLFSRLLKPEEARDVEHQLQKKYAILSRELLAGRHRAGLLLRPVADPPAVQVLVPGFSVRELPVQLPNINNLRYRADGKLVALGYNGNVYLLSDKDGDGLEDTVEIFWENKTGIRGPIGMALTPPKYPHGQGVFVPNKGKLSLIVDADGDDRADKEVVIARGWKEIAQAVDALGVALDKDGHIYFGLGTADFANAYLKTKDGKALYDIRSDRGTIQKLSPDFRKRQTVCTGIRFPVGLAFNRHGDLFATDQEGATWLPNGNPFDELLHIQAGRHYGFPPRHPKILPKVIDEPSVFDYGPQHQSTCGLFFNDPVNGGRTFGPEAWAGEAFVCGESRGKIYRTRLVKTPVGYVAQNHLFACLQMLTVDACLSPKGDMVVCSHSGPPDWGTGPQGKGKLFKISFTDRAVPQPLFAYPAAPHEARIVFDLPLDAEYLRKLPGKVKIEYGAYVRPGDRFETLAPPYAIVKQQLATPRYPLPVHIVQVTPDRRTLVLTTGRHVDGMHYAVTLPGFASSMPAGTIAQHDTIDLGYDLSGVRAEWLGKDGRTWSGWLPHFDLEIARALTAHSAEHKPLWEMVQKPGRLLFHTNLDLWSLLDPAVQPGSKLDYKLTSELTHVHLESTAPVEQAAIGGRYTGGTPTPDGIRHYRIDTYQDAGFGSPIKWAIAGEKIDLRVSFSMGKEGRQRPLPLHRHLVAWATWKPSPAPTLANQDHPELKGGSWARGHALFFNDKSQCGRCHLVRGEGGRIGPDLSNLVHRDYDSVLRDLRMPSAAINPDYLSYVVTLKDGRVMTGTLRGEGDKLWVGGSDGKETSIGRNEIDSLAASPVSVMPEGLDKKLTPVELRDLLFFLLTEPPTKKLSTH